MSDGTEWIDDSISTTPESAIAALEAFNDRPVVLIAGGSDRGQDYDGLGLTLASRAAATHADPAARHGSAHRRGRGVPRLR